MGELMDSMLAPGPEVSLVSVGPGACLSITVKPQELEPADMRGLSPDALRVAHIVWATGFREGVDADLFTERIAELPVPWVWGRHFHPDPSEGPEGFDTLSYLLKRMTGMLRRELKVGGPRWESAAATVQRLRAAPFEPIEAGRCPPYRRWHLGYRRVVQACLGIDLLGGPGFWALNHPTIRAGWLEALKEAL